MNCKYSTIQKMAQKVANSSKGKVSQEQARQIVVKHLERAKRRKEEQ